MTPLSFEQAPPFSVPLRFFLTAPCFGVAAGLTLAFRWEAVTATRWAPDAVAAVHLLTVGFLLQVMAGALLQLLPVAAGANVWRPRLVAGVVHPLLTLGAVALAAGFLGVGAYAQRAAAGLLGLGLGLYVVVALVALLRSPAIGPTLLLLRLAVVGLGVAAGLGVALAALFGWGLSWPLFPLVHAHVAWGALGWAVMLVLAVATLVVPMFQLTPPYAVRTAQALGAGLVGGVSAWSAGLLFELDVLRWVGAVLGGLGVAGFAVHTLRLQAKRRRKVTDTTLWFWRLSMGCLLAAVGLWAVTRLGQDGDALRARGEWVVGALLFVGAFPAAIHGMLPKIVGFLGWLHLQRVMKRPPTMQQLMLEADARRTLVVFVVALALVLGAGVWAPLAVPGGVALALSFALEGWQLARGLSRYRAAARSAGEASHRTSAGEVRTSQEPGASAPPPPGTS